MSMTCETRTSRAVRPSEKTEEKTPKSSATIEIRTGVRIGKSPKPISFKFGLYALLLVCLIILATIDASEGRKSRGRNPRRKVQEDSENDISINESRKGKKAGRRNKILKTSEEARIITERQYLKKDWCKSKPLKQVVRTKNGCKGTFINNFCYGQCNSFYIPKELSGEDREQEAFKSCSFCKPFRVERVSVSLKCPGKRNRRHRVIKRMVNKIMDCRCIAVPDIDSRTPAPEETVSSTSLASATTSGESRR